MKQIVKGYANYQGDFRTNVKPVDIVAQINYDLKKNPSWSVKLLTYINDDTICTVVYDIDESNRVLVESNKEMSFVNIEQVSTTSTENAKDSTPSTVTEVIS